MTPEQPYSSCTTASLSLVDPCLEQHHIAPSRAGFTVQRKRLRASVGARLRQNTRFIASGRKRLITAGVSAGQTCCMINSTQPKKTHVSLYFQVSTPTRLFLSRLPLNSGRCFLCRFAQRPMICSCTCTICKGINTICLKSSQCLTRKGAVMFTA